MIQLPRIVPAVILEHAICVACLLAVPLIVLRPAVFGGQFPLDTDSIFYAIPWEEARPEGLPNEDPGGPRDIVERYYPGFEFLNEAALAGDSTHWNPREGYGVPHFAQWRTRVLSPFSIPYYFFQLRIAMVLSLIAKLAMAGLMAFLTARILWLRPASALLIAVTYQLSPVFLLSPNAPMTDAIVWFPLLLIMFERFGGGRTRVWPASAMVIALMILGGDPESVSAALILGLIYIVVRSLFSGRGLRAAITPVIVFGISAIAGAAMTAIQLLPFSEWLRFAETAVAPEGFHRLRFSDLALSILPRWYGTPNVSSIGGPAAQRVLVAGFLFLSAPLFLSLPYWFSVRPELARTRRPFPDTLAAITAVSILFGGVIAVIGTVSIGFLQFTPAHFWFPLSLWTAIVLARSGEEWSRLMPDPCQDALKRFGIMVPAVLLIWVLTVLVSGPNAAEVSRGFQLLLLIAMAVAFVVVVAAAVLKPNASLFAYGCIPIIAASSIYAFGSAQPYRAPEEVFPVTDTVAAFQQTPGRVSGENGAEFWPLTGNGIANAAVRAGRGLDRQRVLEKAIQDDPALVMRTGIHRLALRDTDLEETFASIRDQMRIDRSFPAGTFWVEMINPSPRARLIYAAQSVPLFSEFTITSKTPPVVEGGPALLESAPSQGSWTSAYTAIDDPNVFDVDAAAPAVLVINEAWYPGWRAKVGVTEANVLPVDAIFRGVPVPPGAHRVELYFDPQPYRIGRGISLIACLIVFVAFVGRITTAIRKRRRLR
jgi:hypothetical protein